MTEKKARMTTPSVIPGLIGDPAFRHPRLRSGIQYFCFCFAGCRPARRGEEDCGVSPPHDEVLLFRQKDPKPVAPGRGPQRGCLCPGPWCVGCGTRCAQTVLAPIWKGRDRGAAPPGGARNEPLPLLLPSSPARSGIQRSVIPDLDRGSSIFAFVLRGFGPARRGEEDCGVSPPHDEVLLFRQKDPKPVAPGRGPARRRQDRAVAVTPSVMLGLIGYDGKRQRILLTND